MLIDVMTENPDHLKELIREPRVDAVFVPEERMSAAMLQETAEACRAEGKQCIIQLPYVFRADVARNIAAREEELLGAGADGWLVRNIDEAAFLQERKWPGLRIFDAGMYGWNYRAREFMRLLGADVLTAPYELTLRELEGTLRKGERMELVIYGRQPAMVSAQCIRKTEKGCSKGRDEYALSPMKDRTGAVFLAQNRCRTCTNVIYNSVPLWLLDQDISAVSPERVRLQFTDEERGIPSKAVREWLEGRPGRPGHFTRGNKTM